MEDMTDDCATMYKLPQNMADELERITFEFGRNVTLLRRYFEGLPGSPRLFRFTAKLHLLCHISSMAKYINPRIYWCWSGEDYMRKMQKLVQSALHGTRNVDVVSKTLEKYCYALDYDLEHML